MDFSGEGTLYHCFGNEGISTTVVLNACLHRTMGEALVLASDNTTLVEYLKKQGCTVHLDMSRMTKEFITGSELHKVSITARYILGKNILAH